MSMKEWTWVLGKDLQYAFRQLHRNRGFATVAILTIALGIGANTAIFRVADAVLLRPLPYPKSGQLVLVWDTLTKIGVKQMLISAEDFEAFRANTHIFQSVVAFEQQDRNLITPSDAERVSTISATPGMLTMLGTSSVIGRSLIESDWQQGHSDAAVISYSLLRRRFLGDHAVIGKTLRLDDHVYTIVGVLPREFEFSMGAQQVDVWTPLPPIVERRNAQFMMLGRLNVGVGLRTAQEAIATMARHLADTAHPYQGPNGEDPGFSASVVSLRNQLFGSFRTGAFILMSTVLVVLLIACVNVANLLIARAAAREKEIEMRRLLGASRMRLIRQWTTEATLLTALGGVAGVLASGWGILLLKALIPGDLPRIARISIDGRVLLFTSGLSALVCLLMAIAPMLSSKFSDARLRGPARRRGMSNILISTEVALTFVLIVSCGLLLKSFEYLLKIDPGFRPDHLLTMEVSLSGPRYEQPANRIAFFSHLQERLEQLPGVVSASGVDRLPIFTVGVDTRAGNPFSVDGHPFDPGSAAPQIAHTQTVEHGYFHTMGIPVLEGRTFSDKDGADSPPVAVINRTLARNVFPNGDAIGKGILLGLPGPGARWMTIVGIIGDIRTGALDLPPMPQFYTSATQDAPSHLFVIVRTILDPLQMEHAASSIVHQLDPEQPVEHMATMKQHVINTMGQPRFETSLFIFFALAALFLAAIGIYGVVGHTTIQRTKEIGIRMALGADGSKVLRTVLMDGLRPVLFGMLTGLAAAILLTRLLKSSLYGVQPNDPLTIFIAGLILTAIAVMACLSPARRATRVDPSVTLRYE
jgi:putative ABC transport system permease protein